MSDQSPPPPPPPPADDPSGSDATPGLASRAWRSFRGWPLWAQITAAIVVLVIIAAAAGSSEQDEEPAASAQTSTTESGEDDEPTSTSTTTSSTTTSTTSTTTTAPTTTTTEPPPQPIVLEGSGDTIQQFDNPQAHEIQWATITHSGGSNFAVWELDSDLEQGDLLVNEVGSYAGNVAIGLEIDVTGFEITADGPWRIEVKPLEMLRAFDGSVDGTGDDVLRYDGDPMVAQIVHSGASNFAVWNNEDLLVNEVGTYSGTVRFGGGPSLVRITADGPWSISPG